LQRERKIPVAQRIRLTVIPERLVQLYDATGQNEKAAEWRKVLEARRGPEAKP
jgi:hypothetical protein